MIVWQAHDGPVYDVVFTPDGRRLVTSGNDKTVRTWDLSTRSELGRWSAPKYAPIAVSADGGYVANGGHQVTVRRTDDSTVLQPDCGWYRGISFSPTSPVFVVHGQGSYPLRRWDVTTTDELPGGWGNEVQVEKLRLFPTNAVSFSPDGTLLSGGFSIRLVNPRTHRFRDQPVVMVWNADTGDEIGRLGPLRHTPVCTHLSFSPDGRVLAGLYGQELIVWEMATKQMLIRRKISDRHFKSLAFTPDGNRLLTASREPVVRVWEVVRWQPCLTYRWDIGNIWCVAVSADGTLAAAGGNSGKVVVWDLD